MISLSVIEIQPLDVAQDLDKLIEQMKEKQKDLETFDDQCVRNLGIHYNQLENVRNKEREQYFCDYPYLRKRYLF